MRDIQLPIDQTYPRQWRLASQPDDPGADPRPPRERFLPKAMAALLLSAIAGMGLMFVVCRFPS